MYLGDVRLGVNLDFQFTTRSFTTGAPTQLAGSPVISAYVDNSTTQLTAGITLTVDFDSVTGLNNVRVVLSGGNGYATATNVGFVITTGTVGGVSVVGEVVGQVSIENRSALMPTTAGRTLLVDASGLADATAVKLGPSGSATAQTARDVGASVLLSSGTGTGQVKLASGYVAPNWGDVGNPTTTVNLSGTTIKAVTDAVTIGAAAVWDYLTSSISTVGSIGKLIKDNLDAAITSRMATYTQPTGFLAATFPTTVASTTNITAGTITTVTNLTNAPTAGDLTATMKTSVTTAASAATPALSAAGVDAIWDDPVDGSVTARQSLRLANSANGGILSGAATTTVAIRDLADTKDRVSATVDASGNRTAVTRDLT